MSVQNQSSLQGHDHDSAPGDEHASETVGAGIIGYAIGLGFATLLTIASFWMAHTQLVWGPGVAIGLAVLAVAQMGVHLVFFLHLTSAPDNTNNILALAFGTLIIALVVTGSLWIMANLNHNMMSMDQLMQMQR